MESWSTRSVVVYALSCLVLYSNPKRGLRHIAQIISFTSLDYSVRNIDTQIMTARNSSTRGEVELYSLNTRTFPL
jgi:hypothetical protein